MEHTMSRKLRTIWVMEMETTMPNKFTAIVQIFFSFQSEKVFATVGKRYLASMVNTKVWIIYLDIICNKLVMIVFWILDFSWFHGDRYFLESLPQFIVQGIAEFNSCISSSHGRKVSISIIEYCEKLQMSKNWRNTV